MRSGSRYPGHPHTGTAARPSVSAIEIPIVRYGVATTVSEPVCTVKKDAVSQGVASPRPASG